MSPPPPPPHQSNNNLNTIKSPFSAHYTNDKTPHNTKISNYDYATPKMSQFSRLPQPSSSDQDLNDFLSPNQKSPLDTFDKKGASSSHWTPSFIGSTPTLPSSNENLYNKNKMYPSEWTEVENDSYHSESDFDSDDAATWLIESANKSLDIPTSPES